MTLSSRHRIRNSSPGGLRPSTLPLGHGGSSQYWVSHVDGEETFCFFQTAETGNRAPNSSVKGSGANHYPRSPVQQVNACGHFPENTIHWSNAGSMLGRRRKWRANINPALSQCIVFAGLHVGAVTQKLCLWSRFCLHLSATINSIEKKSARLPLLLAVSLLGTEYL